MTNTRPRYFPDTAQLREDMLMELRQRDREWIRSTGKKDWELRWATERGMAVRIIDEMAMHCAKLSAENERLKRWLAQ